MLNVVLNGASGRMGQAVQSLAALCDVCIVQKRGQKQIDDELPFNCDAVLDFSLPQGTKALIDFLKKKPCACVIGVTGLDDEIKKSIVDLAKYVPVVCSGNFSIGMNILKNLTEIAAYHTKDLFDVEIVETHHRMKKDAPSGSAFELYESVRCKRNQNTQTAVYGRHGDLAVRQDEEIGIHSIRGGSIVGEHTVRFLGEGEEIELTHRVQSREIFARGALYAVKWAVQQKPGLYSMANVLNLKEI